MPGEMPDDFVHGLKVINCVLDSPGRNTGSETPERLAVLRVSALEIRICTHIRVTPCYSFHVLPVTTCLRDACPYRSSRTEINAPSAFLTKIISPIVVAVDTDSRANAGCHIRHYNMTPD
jgi:hypothetical protein